MPLKHSPRGSFAHQIGRGICLGTVGFLLCAAPASAEDAPVDTVLKALDLKTDVGPTADFVQSTRPKTEPDYLPVGTRHPERSIKVKTPAELKAMEASLDAARSRQDVIAGRNPPVEAPKAAKKRAAARASASHPATQN